MMLTCGEALFRGAAIPARGLFLRRQAAGLFERKSQVDLGTGETLECGLAEPRGGFDFLARRPRVAKPDVNVPEIRISPIAFCAAASPSSANGINTLIAAS